MKKLLIYLLLFLTPVCLHAFAIQPLSTQTKKQKAMAIGEAILVERTDLQEYLKTCNDDGEARELVLTYLYIEQGLDNAEINTKDGRKFFLALEVTEDAVFKMALKTEAGTYTQHFLGADLESSVDIELGKVDFEDIRAKFSHNISLENIGIMTEVVKKMKPLMFPGMKLNLMLVNAPTKHTMAQLPRPFTKAAFEAAFKQFTVIGKLLVGLGFNDFVFKAFPKEWKEFLPTELNDLVTDEARKEFEDQIKDEVGFFVQASIVEEGQTDAELADTIFKGVTGQKIGEYTLVATKLKNGWITIYLKNKDGVQSSTYVVEILPGKNGSLSKLNMFFGTVSFSGKVLDLTQHGLGGEITQVISKYIPLGYVAEMDVMNEQTILILTQSKIKTMTDLTYIFKQTPIGKLLDRNGFGEFEYSFPVVVGASRHMQEPRRELPAVKISEANIKDFNERMNATQKINVIIKKTNQYVISPTPEETKRYYKYICSLANCKYIGIQEGIDEIEDMVLFNEPSGTTLALPISQFSYEAVLKKLGLPGLTLVVKKSVEVEVSNITKEIVLTKEDYIKILRREATHGFENVPSVLKAG